MNSLTLLYGLHYALVAPNHFHVSSNGIMEFTLVHQALFSRFTSQFNARREFSLKLKACNLKIVYSVVLLLNDLFLNCFLLCADVWNCIQNPVTKDLLYDFVENRRWRPQIKCQRGPQPQLPYRQT